MQVEDDQCFVLLEMATRYQSVHDGLTDLCGGLSGIVGHLRVLSEGIYDELMKLARRKQDIGSSDSNFSGPEFYMQTPVRESRDRLYELERLLTGLHSILSEMGEDSEIIEQGARKIVDEMVGKNGKEQS